MPIPNLASATYPGQSEPDAVDFDIISAAAAGYGVLTGCGCSAAAPGTNLQVSVAAGTAMVGQDQNVVTVAGGTLTPGAAAGNPRYDLITVDTVGGLAVVAGTAAASPVFPAIPAGRTVLAAVTIPAGATSIQNVNIIDKRQILNRTPVFGTTSATAARGDHLHSGEYASNAHATTHMAGGSDEITELAYINFPAQNTPPAAPATDDHLKMYMDWLAWRPYPALRSIDRAGMFGSPITGFPHLWLCVPGSGTTLASGMVSQFQPIYAGTGTLSHPTISTALGYRAQLATAATGNATASISSAILAWARGDSVLPWLGYLFHARLIFPDASYANSGASTGVRIFIGLTADTVANALGSDTPTGVRHGFQLVNVNGGKTQTQFQMTVRDGTAESLTSSSMSIVQNHVYDFWIHSRPNAGYVMGRVDDLTAGTTSGSLLDVARVPTATTFMRAMVGMQTINATARAWQFQRIGAEVPV